MNDPYKTPEADLSQEQNMSAVQDYELATRGMRLPGRRGGGGPVPRTPKAR